MPCSNSSIAPLAGLALAASLAVACDRLGARMQVATAPNAPARTQPAAPVAVEEGPQQRAERASPIAGADALSDAVIAARIKASLLTDPAMAGADVSVNADRGVVNLTGTVVSQEQSAIASAHAQRHDGVMRIESHLSVNHR